MEEHEGSVISEPRANEPLQDDALSEGQILRPKSSALDRMSCESMNGFLSKSPASLSSAFCAA